MSLRKAALFLLATLIYMVPIAAASALSDASDKMCSPYYAECGCDQVPDPNNPGKCKPQSPQGELPHSNVHGCGVGTCVDTTNGHITSGICSGPEKCLGELCDGKPCAGQLDGAPNTNGATPAQQPAQIPTQSGITPPSTPNSVYDAARSGVYSIPLPQSGDVNWPQAASNPGTNPSAAQGINDLIGQQESLGQAPTPPPSETPQQTVDRWAGIGENAQVLTPSPESPSGFDTQPNKSLDFGGSNSTGFNAPAEQQSSNFWNDSAQALKNLGTDINSAVNGLSDYYKSTDLSSLNKSDLISSIQDAYSNNGYKFDDTAKLTAYGVCEGMASGCNATEGEPTTYQSHLDENGQPTSKIYTLNDYADGKVPYVTTASGKDSLGETGVIDRISYNDPVTGEQKTLYNVPYQVADTGSAFANGTSKMDVPLTVPESMYGNNQAINNLLNSQPYSGTQVAVASTDGIAPPGPQIASNASPYGVTLSDLNGAQGYGGSTISYPDSNAGSPYSIASLTDLPSTPQSIALTQGSDGTRGLIGSSGDISQLDQLPQPPPIPFTPQENISNEVQQDLAKAMNARIESGIPAPLQVDTNPQADIQATNQAEAQAAQNKAIEDSLLNDRLVQADAETAQYQKDLLAAESKIPAPEMVQVTPEQITKEVVDNNVPVPQPTETNPQQTVENTNQAAANQQLDAVQKNALDNTVQVTQSQLEEQVRQANIGDGKYTLSNAGDLRGQFLADPVTAALLPDSMKAKLIEANDTNAASVTFTQSELDSIRWDKANENQAQKLETLLGPAGYDRTDGIVNDRPSGIADIAALQQIAQEKNGVASNDQVQNVALTSGSAPSDASKPETSQGIFGSLGDKISSTWNDFSKSMQDFALNREMNSLPSQEVSQSGEQVTQNILDAAQKDSTLSPQQRLEEAFNVTQQGEPFQNATPIENPPLPQSRPAEAGQLGINLAGCGGACEFNNTGTDVKAIQQFLNTQPGNNLKVDGIYGSQTEVAVESFQKANNLTVDGIVGPQTVAKMNEIATQQATPVAITPQNQPETPTTGDKQADTSVPLPKPRPAEADQGASQSTSASDQEAAAAQAQKEAAATKSLLRYTNTASAGLTELAKGSSGNQSMMAAGAQAAAAMRQQAATLGDTQLVGLISRYQNIQGQLSATYQQYQNSGLGGFNYVPQLITLRAAALSAGNNAINYVNRNYR